MAWRSKISIRVCLARALSFGGMNVNGGSACTATHSFCPHLFKIATTRFAIRTGAAVAGAGPGRLERGNLLRHQHGCRLRGGEALRAGNGRHKGQKEQRTEEEEGRGAHLWSQHKVCCKVSLRRTSASGRASGIISLFVTSTSKKLATLNYKAPHTIKINEL